MSGTNKILNLRIYKEKYTFYAVMKINKMWFPLRFEPGMCSWRKRSAAEFVIGNDREINVTNLSNHDYRNASSIVCSPFSRQ